MGVTELDMEKEFIGKLVHDLGGDTARVVSEIYSPPRVAAAAKKLSKFCLLPGFSLDLTTCDESYRGTSLKRNFA